MKLWFSSNHSKKSFSIRSRIADIDAEIKKVHLPDRVARDPRSISDYLKYFKASELQSFLPFYGPAVVKPFLPSSYYEHFSLLSETIHNTFRKNTEKHINHAEQLLTNFCANTKLLNSEHYELANSHLLLHLVQCVRHLGPLGTPHQSMEIT